MIDAHTRWHLPPRRVVVGVDFGRASARATALAGAITEVFDATLIAVHADRFEPPPYFTTEQLARIEEERRMAAAAAVAEVRAFVNRVTPCAVHPLVVDEPPVDAVLHAAGDADLIVLGTHGRRGPSRWWLGSVAERVVRASDVPVLVTRGETGAVAEVFSRLVLVEAPAADQQSARQYAALLADTFQGRVIAGGTLTSCRAEDIADASLVVLASAPEGHRWRLADEVADALARCGRPLLFVPRHSRKE